jgi:hypothetical protein
LIGQRSDQDTAEAEDARLPERFDDITYESRRRRKPGTAQAHDEHTAFAGHCCLVPLEFLTTKPGYVGRDLPYLPPILANQLGDFSKAVVNVNIVNFKGGSDSLTRTSV